MEPVRARRQVLVVEDEYFIAQDLVDSLVGAGLEVVGPVASGDEAMHLIESGRRIDAAVLDINVQGQTIYAVVDALRLRAIPFVFATGYDQAAVRPEYRDVPRWEKPLDCAALVRALPFVTPRG